MAVGDLKPPGPCRGDFRARVGSSSSHGLSRPVIDKTGLRDRVVSGPISQDNLRKRTESGGGGRGVRDQDPVRPLVQTLSSLDTGLGSQDSVFGPSLGSGLANVSNLECQV